MINNKKILFILPKSDDKTKSDKIPLGVLYLCTALDRHGYDSEIIDLSIDDVDYLDLIEKEEIRFVGISFVTCNRFDAFDICKKIKQRFPDITIIAGGAHVTTAYDDTLKHIKDIDIIVIGEGELTIVDLMDTLTQESDLSTVKGITYKDGCKIILNEKREFIQDLDVLGLDRSFVSLSDYGQVLPYDKEKTLATSINCIRGCFYKCIVGSPKVFTPKGNISVRNLEPRDKIISWNAEKQSYKTQEILDIHKNKTKKYLKICYYNDGKERFLRVTFDHKIYTKRGWIEAQYLNEDDEILIIECGDKISETKKGNRNPMKRQSVKQKASELHKKLAKFHSLNITKLWKEGRIKNRKVKKGRCINVREANANYKGGKQKIIYI